MEAESAGADRLELNLALELDGLTPSAGLVELVSQAVEIPIIAMARPRGGDFCYSESEWETLFADARWLLKQGVSGIAFGCLDPDGQVDLRRCREMRRLAGERELVFHKAFDDVCDWETGLDRLMEAGIDRVMTSGQASTAHDGIDTLARLVERADHRIEILPAGRIGSPNAVEIVDRTGCRQLHGSFAGNEKNEISAEIGLTIERLSRRSARS